MSSIIAAIVASLAKTAEYIAGIFFNRTKNTTLTDNESAKKASKERDVHKSLVEKSTGSDSLEERGKALDEIRRHISD